MRNFLLLALASILATTSANAQDHASKLSSEELVARDCNTEITPQIAAFLDQSKKMSLDYAQGLTQDAASAESALKKQFQELKLNPSQQDAVLGMMAANSAASVQSLMLTFQKRFWDNPSLFDKDDKFLTDNKIFKKSELDFIKTYVQSIGQQTGVEFKSGEEMNLVKLAAWNGKDSAATLFKNGARLTNHGWDLGAAGHSGALAKPEMQTALATFVPGFDDFKDQINDPARKDPVFLGNLVFVPAKCRMGEGNSVVMTSDQFAKTIGRQLELFNQGVVVKAHGIGAAGAWNFWKGHFYRGPETLTDAEVTMVNGDAQMQQARRIAQNCLGGLVPKITVPTYKKTKVKKTKIIKGGRRHRGPGDWVDVPDREVQEEVDEQVITREDEMDLFSGTEKILSDRLNDRLDGAMESLEAAQWKIPVAIAAIAATGGAATAMMAVGVSGAVVGGGLAAGLGLSAGEVAISSGVKSTFKGTNFWCEVGKNLRENGLTHLGMSSGFMVLGPAFGAMGRAAAAGSTAAQFGNGTAKAVMYGFGIHTVGASSLAAFEFHGMAKKYKADGDDNMAALSKQRFADSAGNATGAALTFVYPWVAEKTFVKKVTSAPATETKPSAVVAEPVATPLSNAAPKNATPTEVVPKDTGHTGPASKAELYETGEGPVPFSRLNDGRPSTVPGFQLQRMPPKNATPTEVVPKDTGHTGPASKAELYETGEGPVPFSRLNDGRPSTVPGFQLQRMPPKNATPTDASQIHSRRQQIDLQREKLRLEETTPPIPEPPKDVLGAEFEITLPSGKVQMVKTGEWVSVTDTSFKKHTGYFSGRNSDGTMSIQNTRPNSSEDAALTAIESRIRPQVVGRYPDYLKQQSILQRGAKNRNKGLLVKTVELGAGPKGATQTAKLEHGRDYIFTDKEGGKHSGQFVGLDDGTPFIKVNGAYKDLDIKNMVKVEEVSRAPATDGGHTSKMTPEKKAAWDAQEAVALELAEKNVARQALFTNRKAIREAMNRRPEPEPAKDTLTRELDITLSNGDKDRATIGEWLYAIDDLGQMRTGYLSAKNKDGSITLSSSRPNSSDPVDPTLVDVNIVPAEMGRYPKYVEVFKARQSRLDGRNAKELVDTVELGSDQNVRLAFGHDYVFTDKQGVPIVGQWVGIDRGGTPVIKIKESYQGLKIDNVAHVEGVNGSPNPAIVKGKPLKTEIDKDLVSFQSGETQMVDGRPYQIQLADGQIVRGYYRKALFEERRIGTQGTIELVDTFGKSQSVKVTDVRVVQPLNAER